MKDVAPYRRFDSVLSHSPEIKGLQDSVPSSVPRAHQNGLRYHSRRLVESTLETALILSFTAVFVTAAFAFLAHGHRLMPAIMALAAVGTLYGAHGSFKRARWHARRKHLHAAAADRKAEA